MGNLGFQELMVFFSLFTTIAIPCLFYYLGKKAGYKQGQLDMYKKQEAERK